MELLGILVVSTFYWCFFVAYTTARWHWIYICFWLIPIYFMTINFEQGMEINGLMVLFSIAMFSVCRKSLIGVSLWNVQKSKEHSIFLNIIHFVVALITFYSFSQAQIQGYMIDIQGWGSKIKVLPMFISIVLMIGLTRSFSHMIYMAIDRIGKKQERLVLLYCQFFISNEFGIENSVFKGYYLEGIQNGITYHFRMTKNAFRLLENNDYLELELTRGLFGGQYVYELENEIDKEFEKQSNLKYLVIGVVGFVVVILGFILIRIKRN